MELHVNRDDNYPAYRQIADQLADMVKSGELQPGDRLPTERDLSVSTAISRGTITRVYDELASAGIVERIQGKGTFVRQTRDISHFGRQGEAMVLIDRMLDDLVEMHLSYREMETLIGSKIQRRRLFTSNVRIAVVDCNLETLGLISGQLYSMSDVDVTELVIGDLVKAPQRLTYGYDLILTTENHYLQVIAMAPTVADRVVKVEISPSQKLLYELALMEEGERVGIWCMSQEYANAVYERIAVLEKKDIQIQYHLDCEPGNIRDFVQDKTLLILPNDYVGGDTPEDIAVMEQFREEGRRIIFFEYRIDEGSLIHLRHEIELVRRSKHRSANIRLRDN